MDSTNPSPYSLAILHGMQGKPMYAGTVAPGKVKRNRAAAKVARKSRRTNRRSK